MTPEDEKIQGDFSEWVRLTNIWAPINDEMRLYQTTGNGLCVWNAYAQCRAAGVPVPEGILRCLDRFAGALHSANSSDQVAQALDMHGFYGKSAPKHRRQAQQTAAIISEVHQLMTLKANRLSKNAACKKVGARRGMSGDAVEKRYDRWMTPKPPRRAQRVGATRPRNSVFGWGHETG